MQMLLGKVPWISQSSNLIQIHDSSIRYNRIRHLINAHLTSAFS